MHINEISCSLSVNPTIKSAHTLFSWMRAKIRDSYLLTCSFIRGNHENSTRSVSNNKILTETASEVSEIKRKVHVDLNYL